MTMLCAQQLQEDSPSESFFNDYAAQKASQLIQEQYHHLTYHCASTVLLWHYRYHFSRQASQVLPNYATCRLMDRSQALLKMNA